MEKFALQKNTDGTYNLIIYVRKFETEFGSDLFEKSIKRLTDVFLTEKCRNLTIKTVKFVLTGGIVICVPFCDFVSAKNESFYTMSYVYFGSVAEQIENVKNSFGVINTVSPSYFDLTEEGKLEINGLSELFVNEMHGGGVKVVPFLSNHWNKETGEKALKNSEELATEIAAATEKYSLDGVYVDIENVDHNYREAYTDFVRLLREKIPKNKEVSVAVAANPYGWTNGWQGSYDYEKLSEYADCLMIMSYDEHFEGGDAGPVASIGFIRDSIEYALEYVPEEKILIGIPFYGRLWGGGIQGKGISLNRADELLSLYNAEIFFDQDAMSPAAKFTIYSDSPEFVLGGKKLKPGNYTLWFENELSLAAKTKLVEEYGIKGVGNWSAGQEKEEIWSYYELWAKGIYFNDIINHFAKDDIIKIYSEGVMIGKSPFEFKPNEPLTRAEAAVIISRTAGLEPQSKTIFSDVAGHYAEKYINAAAKNGYILGYPDGTFKPEEKLSRMETAALLARLAELDYHGGESEFSDVNNAHWSFKEISALTEAGIMKGYADGTFKPNNPVTRGEMAALLWRMEKNGK